MKKILIVVMSMVLCACTQKKSDETLKIGVMPSYDSTPILWAYDSGIFEEMGVNVELTVYANGNDRDTQIQTGAVDAVVTDIMGLITLVQAGHDVKGVSKTDTVFSVVGQESIKDKTNLTVGMAEISVTQYAADKGLTGLKLEKQFIDAIPQRLEMAAQGLLDGAILPEPMASMSKLKGMQVTELSIESPNVLVFTQNAIDTKNEDIKRFYEAYDEAVTQIPSADSQVKDSLINHLNLDPAIKDVLVLPHFSESQSISEYIYEDVSVWMTKVLNMTVSTDYMNAVHSLTK